MSVGSVLKDQTRTVLFAVAVSAVASLCLGAEETPKESVGEKALKYHALLVKRPEPGYLFDRFYNTWLDESTVDTLEAFLLKKVQSSNVTGDRLLLAFFYAKKGDDVAALDQFRQALEHNPASAATWYHKALVEARTLDFDLAIADLKKAREQKPDDKLAVQIDKQLGKLLARNRQADEALKVWKQLLASNPTDEELSEDVIELQLDEGLFKEAAQLEEQLVGRTKDEYLAITRRLRLGDIHHRAGERAKAVEIYTAALDSVGADSWLEREILAQIDQVYRREDDVAGLKKLYSELLTKYSKRIAIHRRHAQLLVESGEQEPAIAAYREILKLTPGERGTREEYIGVLTKIGKTEEALNELQGLCDQYPKDSELRFRLASAYQEAKQPEKAVAGVDKYLEASDGTEYAYLRAARLLERLDKKDAAANVYEKMTAKFADSSSAHEAYAVFLYSTGRKEEAIKLWRDMAKGADLKQTLQVARSLSSRAENEAAFDVLKQHIAEIKNDPLLLGQLVTTANALKKYDEAIPWATERVQLAETVPDLEAALDQAASTIEHADKVQEETKRLESLTKRGVSESCLLAELLERGGDSDKADAELKKAVGEGSLLALSQQVRLASQRREWSQAAEATRKILELPGGVKSLHVRRLVELYQRDYQLEEGLKWIAEWKRLSPGSTTPWVTEARMLQMLGKNQDALKVLRTATLKFEDDEDLRVRLAEFYAETDKAADALRIYWQLYEDTEDLNGKLRWAQKLASIAEQQGTKQQLVQDFEERVRGNRQSIVPLLALAEVYRETDDYEGRRRALTAAAKIKPDDMYLLQQVARVEEQNGDWKAAVATLERAAAMDKTNRTREQIANLYLANDEAEKGYSILFELVAAADADPRTIEATADSLCAAQEWARAAEFLSRYVPNHPNDYRLRYLYAVALEEADRASDATPQFIQLLSNQEELPTKKTNPATQNMSMGDYFDMLRKLLPPEAFDWMRLTQYRYTAYAHRQQRGGAYMVTSAMAGAGRRSAIQMPADVDSVRPLVLAHLLSLAATLDDDKQDLLCKDIEAHGLRHAKALMHTDPNRGDLSGFFPELLEKNPKDEAVLALLVMNQTSVRNIELAPHCATAVELFRKSRPELALMAAIQAGVNEARTSAGSDDKSDDNDVKAVNKNLDEALSLADSVEHPNPMTVMSLTSVLGGRNAGAPQELAISESYRQKLSQLLVKWYPDLSRSPQYAAWAYFAATQSLSKNSDPAPYIHFLDDEVNRFQTSGKSQGSRGQRQFSPYQLGRQQTTLLAPLEFPPAQLADFPPHVLSTFATQQNMNPYGFNAAELEAGEEFGAKVKPLLDSIKSPILRILFANRAELNDVVDASLKQMLAAKTPQLDAYILAASWAEKHDKHSEAVGLLEKSRYLPMRQEVRKLVDGAIVAAVMASKQSSKDLDKELLEAGQQASLRLRRSRLEATQRNELIAAMEELGLKKEAEKLDALAAASPSASSGRIPTAIFNQSVQRTPPDRISKLIEQGKRDEAIKQLTNEVVGNVRNVLGNPQIQRYQRQQFRDVKQRVEAHSMADEVLKSLEPGDSKNNQKVLEYATACDLFGRSTEARAAFEKALSIRPKDDTARTRLILLLAPGDLSAAGKHIEQLSKVTRVQLGDSIAEQMQDFEASYEERLSYARLALEYLRTLKADDVQQSNWIENVMTYLSRYMQGRQGSLPSLYSTKINPEDRRQSQNKEIMTERRKILQELCEEMLIKPDLARTGFKHWLAFTEAQEQLTDEFAARAEKILLDEAEAKPRPGGVQQTFYFSGGQNEVRFRTPEEFLSRRAWKSGDWKLIDEAIIPKLAGSKNREARDRLEQMATLYRCNEDEFLDKAAIIVKQSKPAIQPGQSSEGIAIAVDVCNDRELKVDLQPLVLKQLKQDISSQNHYQPAAYVVSFLEGMAKTGDKARQLAFLDEIATLYIAPPGKRNDFIKKNYSRQNISWGTPNGRIYVYMQLMEQLCQRSDLMFVLLEHLDQYDNPKPVQNYEYRVRTAINQMRNRDADATMKMLAQSPWLEDLDQFRPLVLTARNSGGEAPLVSLLRPNDKKTEFRKELKAAIEKQQEPKATFGGQLILAGLAEEPNSPAVLEFVGGKLDDIKNIQETRQQELAALIRALAPPKSMDRLDLTDKAKAAKDWLAGSRTSSSRATLAKLEKAKRLEDIGVEYGQADQFVREQLQTLIADDTNSAVKAFQRVCALAHEAQKRGEWHMHFSDGTTIDGYLLRAVGYTNNQTWKAYNFTADVLRSTDGPKIEAGDNVSQILNNIVIAAYNRAGQSTKAEKNSAIHKVQKLYDEIGEAIDDRASSLLLPTLYSRLKGEADQNTCKAVLEWSSGEASNGKYPVLAADLHALYGLLAAEKERATEKSKSESRLALADYHEHFRRILTDDSLPITWRLYIAEFLTQRQTKIMPVELAKDIVTIYVTALADKAPIQGNQNDSFIDTTYSIRDEESAKEMMADLRTKWAERYLRPSAGASANRYQRNAGADSTYDLNSSGAVIGALRVYLAAGELDRCKQLLQKYSPLIAHLPQTISALLRADQAGEAARSLRSGWPKLEIDWPSESECYYDADIENRVPLMVEKLEREEERYLTKVLFASMPDEKSSKKKAKTKTPSARDERLSKQADDFTSVDFKEPAIRKLCLVILGSSEVSGRKIADQLTAAYDPKNVLLAYAGDDHTRLAQETRLAQRVLANKLRDGDTATYVDLVKRLAANPDENDYQFGDAASPFVDCLFSALKETETKKWTFDQIKSVDEALRGMLKDRDYVNIRDFAAYTTILAVLACEQNSQAGFDEWLKTLSANNRNRVENSNIKAEVWQVALTLRGPATPENLEARKNFVHGFAGLSFNKKWLSRGGLPYRLRGQEDRNFLTGVVKANLLSSDELKTHGLAIMEGVGTKDEPSYGKAALANWLQSEKDYEKAAEVWRSIAKIDADAKKAPRNEANYVLGLATCLKNLKRFDEALKTLEILEGKDVDNDLRASYEQYKSEIETAKTQKPEAEPPAEKSAWNRNNSPVPITEKFVSVTGAIAV